MPTAIESPPTNKEALKNGSATETNPFYVTGGTLPPSAPSYITRKADNDLYEALKIAQFCYVLNTRQIGKSSLMIRTVRRLKDDGAAVVVLDLTAVGQNLTVEQWYDGLLVMLSEQLHLEDDCEDFWLENDNLGPMQRFFATIKEVILPAIGNRTLVLFVDEIDAVRSLPFSADEFFAGIRECFNRRVQDPAYNRLTFCLLGVATPADLIQDTRISPFNIGRRVTLKDFSPEEAAPLSAGMGANGKKLLERALYWTGGHPYLTQRLCREISRNQSQTVADVDRLTEQLFLSKRARDSDDNLSFVQNRMLRSEFPLPDVLDFYGKLRSGKRVKDDETNSLCGLLRLAGIASVDESTDLLKLRNRIYETVFDREWVLKNMPDAELRRQRQAAFAARLQVGSIAAVVIVAMAILTVRVFQTGEEAKHQATVARQEKARAENERNNANQQRILAEQQKTRASNAEKVANVRAIEAKRSAQQARRSAMAAIESEKHAREGEAKAVKAQKEALDQKIRADKAAIDAQHSAKQAELARKDADSRREESEAQKKLAERQTQVATAASKRAQEESDKAKLAADEAKKARAFAEAQKAVAEKKKNEAEVSLERLKDANNRRIERLKVTIATNPTDVESAIELAKLYLDLASIYDDTGREDNALNYYSEAAKTYGIVLARKPGDYVTLAQRGFCYKKLKQYAEAIADFSEQIAQKPKEAGSAYLSRARVYADMKRPDLVLKDLVFVEKYEPTQMDYQLRGDCLIELRDFDAAAEAFSHMLKTDQTRELGYYRIGDARRLQHDYNAAYSAYTRYQETYPEREDVYQIRIACLLGGERWADTVRLCTKYRRLFPKNAIMYPWHAYALLNLKDFSGYKILCDEVIGSFGGEDSTAENANYAAWTCALGANGLADYSVPIQIAQKAVADAEKQRLEGQANKEDPYGATWANRNTLAALYMRAGKYNLALKTINNCEAIPRNFTTDNRFSDYILFALVYAETGNQAEADKYLKLAHSLPPSLDLATLVEQNLFLKEADMLIHNK